MITTVSPAPTREVLAVDDAGKGFGERSLGEADALGDPGQPVDGEDLAGNDHVLGEPAGELVAHRELVGADGLVAGEAVGAGSVGNGGDDLYPVTGRPPRHSCPDLGDLTGDLVPHYLGRRHVRVP